MGAHLTQCAATRPARRFELDGRARRGAPPGQRRGRTRGCLVGATAGGNRSPTRTSPAATWRHLSAAAAPTGRGGSATRGRQTGWQRTPPTSSSKSSVMPSPPYLRHQTPNTPISASAPHAAGIAVAAAGPPPPAPHPPTPHGPRRGCRCPRAADAPPSTAPAGRRSVRTSSATSAAGRARARPRCCVGSRSCRRRSGPTARTGSRSSTARRAPRRDRGGRARPRAVGRRARTRRACCTRSARERPTIPVTSASVLRAGPASIHADDGVGHEVVSAVPRAPRASSTSRCAVA